MKKNLFLNSLLRTAAALLTLVTLPLAAAPPALALDLNPADYFKFNFEPTAFDKTSVSAGEVFHAVIKGSADCIQDLPLPITEISIKSQVVARPVSGGADLLLNPEYIIGIKPLPNKAGDTFVINQTVNLQFPAGAASGNYAIIARLTEAKVKVLVWLDVTSSFPAETLMGAVRYAVPSTAPATTPPAGTVTPVTAPAITIPPATTLNPSVSNAATTGSFPLTTIVIIGLIVVIVILLIIVIILLRGRGN